MNIPELQRALRQLRLGGIAAVLETRLHQAQAEPMAPIDLIACLISDELTRRGDRLLERRRKQAGFRDPHTSVNETAAAYYMPTQAPGGAPQPTAVPTTGNAIVLGLDISIRARSMIWTLPGGNSFPVRFYYLIPATAAKKHR